MALEPIDDYRKELSDLDAALAEKENYDEQI